MPPSAIASPAFDNWSGLTGETSSSLSVPRKQSFAGIPVACVSIGGARNAGLLAVRVLASAGDELGLRLAGELAAYSDDLQATVLAKHEVLRTRTGR